MSVVGQSPESSTAVRAIRPHASFRDDVVPVPGYVYPDFAADDAPNASVQVVLITAPGAMGKSAAGSAIAADRKAPLIDLARLRVGSNSLTGLLTRTLGWDQAPAFFDALKAGRTSLILDSLDEAQLGAGRENFIAFLTDIAELLSGGASSRQIVALGRPDATETTARELKTLGISVEVVDLCPLGHTQASELIDLALDKKKINDAPYVTHRVHPVPFGNLRDQTFRDISTALHEAAPAAPASDGRDPDYWLQSGSFLGYTPVVLALAERLAVDNPQHELQKAQQSTWDGTVQTGSLLRKVVEDILDRERQKVSDQTFEALKLPTLDPRRKAVFARVEQTARLLQFVSKVELGIDSPAILTDIERETYEQLLESFIPDHPFLFGDSFANVVFADYARAFALTSTVPYPASSMQQVVQNLPAPGPFFARFVASLCERDGDVPVVPESLVDDLIHSNVAGSRVGFSTFTQRGEDAWLSLGDASNPISDQEDPSADGLIFKVVDPSGALEVTSPISRGLFMSDLGLVIGTKTGEIELGPNVVVSVNDLELIGNTLSVHGNANAPFNGALLIGQNVTHSPTIQISVHPTDSLAVSWPNLWHQWKPYSITMPTSGILSAADSSQIFLGLRRILTSFKSAPQNEPSAFREKMDRFQIGKSPIFAAVMRALIDLGIVGEEGPLYRLHLEALGKFGVTYTGLFGPDHSTQLSRLHSEVAQSEHVQKATEG